MSSSVVDEDTARTINDTRAAIGAMLSTAQTHLQKAFIVFVIGLLATIYALRLFIWDELKAITTREMSAELQEEFEILAVTPFDVILLQVKIGLVVGIFMALPVVLYYSRDELRRRGLLPPTPIPRWKIALLGIASAGLFVVGVLYGYYVFFPFMFHFLAANAVMAEIKPTYSIVLWTEFIVLLTFSFGLAAQLPLIMSALSYTEIVPYETFRDKWRYAIVGIFVFGAFFSPPDPFTQIMWAVPLILLYGFSLYLAKVITMTKRGSAEIDLPATARGHWNQLAGTAVLAFGAVYLFFTGGGIAYVNEFLLPTLGAYQPAPFPTLGEATPLSNEAAAALVGATAALFAIAVVLMYLVYVSLESDVESTARTGDPAAIDLTELDAAGIRAAPPEPFEEMTEAESLRLAQEAMDDEDPERAKAILGRYDAAHEDDEDEAGNDEEGDADKDVASADPEESSDPVTDTATGMVNAFTAEETTEDDIGGYYWDIAFVLESLTSKMFRIVGTFIGVLGLVFWWLYQGGLGQVKDRFLERIPDVVIADAEIGIIALHPVEALIFNVKVSTIVAAAAVLPMVLYYAWPALEERGLASGNRNVLFGWTGAMIVGFVVGSLLGFLYIAPALISYLVYDAIDAGMIISYRLNNFFWLIFMTTVGIGLLANVPMTMIMFHIGGLASYRTMYGRWREFAIGVFVFSALLTPGGVLTMFMVAVPILIAYWIGLAILWVVNVLGWRGPPPASPASSD